MKRGIGIFVLIFVGLIGYVGALESEVLMEVGASENLEEIKDFDFMEVIDRGSDYNVYRGENGSRVARVSSGVINYLSEDSYEPINTTVVSEGCEFDWCVREGVYWADFKEKSSKKDIVRFLFNGSYISYTPLPLRFVGEDEEEVIAKVGKVSGRAEGAEFFYDDVYGEGLSLGYEYKNSFLKEDLIIQDLEDLGSPSFKDAYLSLDFVFDSMAIDEKKSRKTGSNVGNSEIDAGDELIETEVFLSGEVREERGVVGKFFGMGEKVSEEKEWDKSEELKVKGEARFEKDNGEFAFRMPTPYAVDADGAVLELEYVFVEKDGSTVVSVLTPYEWLADEDRAYPVRVDPSTGSLE